MAKLLSGKNLEKRRYSEFKHRLAAHWLNERERAAKFVIQVEQAQLALSSSIAARDAADAARDQAAAAAEANRIARHANVVATISLILAVVAIAVSILAAFLSQG